MAEEAVKPRMSAAELIREQREAHDAEIALRDKHLCICGTKDVLMLTGAMTFGLAAGFAGVKLLQGRWRIAPVVAGVSLVGTGYFLSPSTVRFAKKASLAVGGLTMLGSSIIFTFVDRIQKEEEQLA